MSHRVNNLRVQGFPGVLKRRGTWIYPSLQTFTSLHPVPIQIIKGSFHLVHQPHLGIQSLWGKNFEDQGWTASSGLVGLFHLTSAITTFHTMGYEVIRLVRVTPSRFVRWHGCPLCYQVVTLLDKPSNHNLLRVRMQKKPKLNRKYFILRSWACTQTMPQPSVMRVKLAVLSGGKVLLSITATLANCEPSCMQKRAESAGLRYCLHVFERTCFDFIIPDG